ncbi:MAG: GAF domain-containing protein [Thermoflexales bacterium]|nr:GAF domain-containing protein [Thermoflexales bacterium]
MTLPTSSKSATDSTLMLRTAIAQGDLSSLLTELNAQLHQQAAVLTRLPGTPDVMKAQQTLLKIQSLMPRFQTAVDALVHERQALQALYEVGQAVNSTLELSDVLNQVMDRIIQLTGAERSFLMLKDETTGELEVRVARNVDRETLRHSEFAVSWTIVQHVTTDGRPIATTNAQADPRFAAQESVVAYSLRSILCVPMLVRDQVTGVIYADNRIRTGLFGDRDRDMLAAFANQAALAIENARLFERVRQQLAAITVMRDLMDNVFESITSGVITTDMDDRVTMFNRAAETMLGVTNQQVIEHLYQTALPIALDLKPWIDEVKLQHNVIARELERDLPPRGAVELSMNFAPLKGSDAQTVSGVAIVLDDLTEKRRLEADQRFIKETFMRYAPPAVVEQLLRDPSQLKLGGVRKPLSILFADIRGFTTFSERLGPEELVEVLNSYLAMAADSVLAFDGVLDKFMGDAVMGLFNVPLDQTQYTLRAVKAALKMQQAINEFHTHVGVEHQLNFGVGINAGEAVVGNIGTEKQRNYTAIGDAVNYAKRLQENAKGGQILISLAAFELVKDQISALELPPLQVKGRSVPEPVWEVIGLR